MSQHQPHVRRNRARRERDGQPHADRHRCRGAGARRRRRRVVSPQGGGPDERISAQGAAAIALMAGLLNRRLPGPGSAIIGTAFRYAGACHIGDTLTATVTAKASTAHGHHRFRSARARTSTARRSSTASPWCRRRPAYRVRQRRDAARSSCAATTASPSCSSSAKRCRRHLRHRPSLRSRRAAGPDRGGEARTDRSGSGRSGGEDPRRRARRGHRPLAVPDRSGGAQPCRRGESGRAGARRPGRRADEGEPSHRRADGRGRVDRRRAPYGAAHLARVRDGRPDLSAAPDGHRLRDQSLSESRGQGRHLPERDRSRAYPRRSRSRGSRSCPPSRRSTRAFRERSTLPHCARWPTAARSGRHSRRSARVRQRDLGRGGAHEGIDSPVAGRADILLVPDLEAGNMLAKQLQYLAGADSAGIVLGTRVPIVLTSRSDNVRTRLASAAVMKLVANARRSRLIPRE